MSCAPRIVLASLLLPLLGAEARPGAVTSQFPGGKLILHGSGTADVLTLEKGPGATDVLVTPGADTTLDGAADPVLFADVQELRLFLKGGADEATLTNVALTADFVFEGQGDDDHVTFNACTLEFDARIALGPGNDTVVVNGTTIVGELRVLGSSGDDFVQVGGASDIGKLKAPLGSGSNSLQVTGNSTLGDLDVTGGADGNSLDLADTTISGGAEANFGF